MMAQTQSQSSARTGIVRRLGVRLFGVVVLLGLAFAAEAQDCSDYPNGVIDGFAGDVAPSQLQIDRNCTIRNFPAANPLNTNFSFFTQPGQTNERWLIIFDNVVHTGNMSCNAVLEHKIWFTAVLDDSSANRPSTQFVNTAKWDFGTYEIATQ